MSAHLSNQIIESYRLQKLTPSELLDADDHIGTCERCRELLFLESGLTDTVPLLKSELMSAPELIPMHLGYLLSSSYLDGQLVEPDIELVQEHLKSCTNCAIDLYDLALFKQALESEDTC